MTKRKKSRKKLKKLPLLKRSTNSRRKPRKKSKRKTSKRKTSKRKTSKRKGMLPYLDKETVLQKNVYLESLYVDLVKKYSDDPLSKQTVLEIGSGNGRMTFMLASHFHKWYALEPSVSMLDMAKKIKPKEITNVEFYQAGAEDLPFLDNSIDIVIYTFSFHFIKNKSKALSEAYRVLKDNGTMFILEPSKHFGSAEIRIGSPMFDQKFYDRVLKKRKPTIRYINNIYKMPEWKQVFHFASDRKNINLFRKT